ncbi:DUF4468 domain-containing protein [Hymenobacter rubidus]|uniref:DUF4468 domain-containing protein n=1 Tax=Hymenobacter rubidus TaxID=1441626 RepID=UPI00191FE290|nr:DUF4468 domain-containing protein [Hymenobacter rubidus]
MLLLLLFASGMNSQAAAQKVMHVPELQDIRDVLLDSATGRTYCYESIPVEYVSKAELNCRARELAVNNLNGDGYVVSHSKYPITVIRIEESNVGDITFRGFHDKIVKDFGNGMQQRLYFTVKISTIDGRYRYELLDFDFQSDASGEVVPVEQFLKVAYSADGEPNYAALTFAEVFLMCRRVLIYDIKKGMKTNGSW